MQDYFCQSARAGAGMVGALGSLGSANSPFPQARDAAPVPKPMTMIDRLAMVQKILGDVENILRSVNDKLVGPIPENAIEGTPGSPSVIGQIMDLQERALRIRDAAQPLYDLVG